MISDDPVGFSLSNRKFMREIADVLAKRGFRVMVDGEYLSDTNCVMVYDCPNSRLANGGPIGYVVYRQGVQFGGLYSYFFNHCHSGGIRSRLIKIIKLHDPDCFEQLVNLYSCWPISMDS